jgi:hypothetical protein
MASHIADATMMRTLQKRISLERRLCEFITPALS